MRRNNAQTKARGEAFLKPDAVASAVASDRDLFAEKSFRSRINAKGEVMVASDARVKADINAASVTVGGHVVGNITAHRHVAITATGRVTGDVETTTISIAEGGVLEGFCKTKGKNEESDVRLESDPQHQIRAGKI